jgi:hypothetical protein
MGGDDVPFQLAGKDKPVEAAYEAGRDEAGEKGNGEQVHKVGQAPSSRGTESRKRRLSLSVLAFYRMSGYIATVL